MADKIAQLIKAHDRAVDAQCRWAMAAAKGHSTEKLYARYELSEARFDVALTKLQDDFVRNPSKYR